MNGAVAYFATACAYQVVTTDANGSIVDDYTAGNSEDDSQAFTHPDDGVGLAKMQEWALQTANETADAKGIDRAFVYEDRDLEDGLEEVYGGWPVD